MDTPEKWPQSYEKYAGFNTEKMRQRARGGGNRDAISLPKDGTETGTGETGTRTRA
jgi:hypothetical protein